MLETLKPLIGKLCSGTSVTPENFENGYAFSSYNTDFFAVWTIEDRFCFSWSERHPSAAFCIDTQSATIASYIVIAAVGALRRADLFQDAISPAILTDELRSRWVSSPRGGLASRTISTSQIRNWPSIRRTAPRFGSCSLPCSFRSRTTSIPTSTLTQVQRSPHSGHHSSHISASSVTRASTSRG